MGLNPNTPNGTQTQRVGPTYTTNQPTNQPTKEPTVNKPPILNIQMVPAGVDLVIKALMQLPYGEVAPLIAELRGQAEAQLTPAPVADTPQEDRTNDTAPVDLVGE
jgi:hypothetical protein